ncbi:MAG TPA: serine hydrolase [Candidatus Saccharimonadales bacterium]|nr:serine hydrolase [Candidatus Saccharimonadales bacterium]
MRLVKFVTVTVLLGIVVLGGYEIISRLTASTPGDGNNTPSSKPVKAVTAAEMKELQSQLEGILATSSVSSSVAVIDSTSGQQLRAGLTVPFRAASTTKVLSAAAYIHQVEAGKARLDTPIQGVNAQSLLRRMLNQSDNNAWAAVDRYLTQDGLRAYAQSIGLTSFDPDENTLTAQDMASLLDQMHRHKIMSASHADLLFSFMQDTNNEELIPAGLPTGATVYHKFGFYEGELHDAAVISYKGRTFVLVIYTNNELPITNDYTSRAALMQQITAKVTEQMPVIASD